MVACCMLFVNSIDNQACLFQTNQKSMFFGRTFKETVPRSNLFYIIKIMEN